MRDTGRGFHTMPGIDARSSTVHRSQASPMPRLFIALILILGLVAPVLLSGPGGNAAAAATTLGDGTWTRMATGLEGGKISSLALSPSFVTDQTLFAATIGAGVFRSTNAGSSWSAANSGLGELRVNAVAASPDFQADQTLFAATATGIFKTTNGAASWVHMAPDVITYTVSSIAFSPNYAVDHTVFAGGPADSAKGRADRRRHMEIY